MVLYLVTLTDLQTRRAGLSASAELLVFTALAVVLLRRRAWMVGWVAIRHTPVLYQTATSILNTFSTFLLTHHSSFF